MRISRKTLGIVNRISFCLGVKILVLILAAFGIANMWLAVFADVGVAVYRHPQCHESHAGEGH